MNSDMIVAAIDSEIALLKQARTLLAGETAESPSKRKAGSSPKKKRNLTPEGRKRIVEAVRRRWAKQKKAASK